MNNNVISFPAGNYMFKVNNNVNFQHISHLCSSVSIVNFEQVNAGCVEEYLIYLMTGVG